MLIAILTTIVQAIIRICIAKEQNTNAAYKTFSGCLQMFTSMFSVKTRNIRNRIIKRLKNDPCIGCMLMMAKQNL